MDWTVSLEAGRTETAGFLSVWASSLGKPYIARITGRDTTYGWARTFLKPQRSYPSTGANPAAIVRLVLPVRALEPLPVALDIRWGPNTGSKYVDANGQSGQLCVMRGLFILDAAGLRQVEERHVAWLIDERIVVPGPPKRPPDMRAKREWSDNV
jgi:hypothetical protein